jgi:hypothetical protein
MKMKFSPSALRLATGLSLLGFFMGCASPEPAYTPRRRATVRRAPRPKRQQVKKAKTPTFMPRVMVIVDEKSLGTIATSEVETMAIKMLVARNIPVVDQDMVRANVARSQQMLITAGDNRGAAALGTQFGADIVLIGEAVAKPSARRIADTNLRSYQAVASLRAVRTDNSSTLAAVSEDVTKVGLEDVSGSAKALRGAAEKTLNELIPVMLSKWTPGTTGVGAGAFPHRVEIVVGGVDKMWKLKSVRDSLRGRKKELKNVAQRSYTAGVAEFSMESALPTEELAEALVLLPPDGLSMQVLDIGGGRIQARAVAK